MTNNPHDQEGVAADAQRRSVGILAFEAMEVLDYAGPYEVFNVAGELAPGPFEVRSLAVGDGEVVARGGFTVVPDGHYRAVPVPEVLIVPGGAGTRALLAESELLEWLRQIAGEVEVLASVCTGSLLLGAAGLLENRRATTHHGAFSLLAEISPTTEIVTDERYVYGGENVWTSGGISAGIDLSLALIEALVSAQLRAQVVEAMEWGWHT